MFEQKTMKEFWEYVLVIGIVLGVVALILVIFFDFGNIGYDEGDYLFR